MSEEDPLADKTLNKADLVAAIAADSGQSQSAVSAVVDSFFSIVAKNDQRAVIVERYAAKRLELKKALVDPNGTDESREAARVGLQKLPRDASPVRLRNRDSIDGRPRGVLSRYGISRVRFRDMAHRGELPGVTKSSW